MFDRFPDRAGLELTLQRIAIGARLLGLGWLSLLAGLTLTSTVESPAWVAGPLAAAVIWAVVNVVANRKLESAATTRIAVLVDVALASVVLIAPEQAGIPTVGFYGGYPLITVAVAAIRSRRAGFGAALWLVLVVLGGFRTRPEGLVASLSQILLYVAAALIISWAVGVIRAAEDQRRRAQEAVARAEADGARAEERAQISRHLHDSVLQTLALIQKSADQPREVAGLARRQERELRSWLYGEAAERDGLAAALRKVCAKVEDDYRVEVAAVIVGDAGSDPTIDALVAAAREAIVNAAKYSGCDYISVFAEVADEHIGLFVRDRGIGFDPDAVPAARRGIRDSIIGRLERIGGSAQVRSGPGGGTEWKLSL